MLPRLLTIYRFNYEKKSRPCSGQFLTWFNSYSQIISTLKCSGNIYVLMKTLPFGCYQCHYAAQQWTQTFRKDSVVKIGSSWNDVSIFWRRLILHYPLLTSCLLIEMNNVCAFDTIIESILKWNSPHYYGSWSKFICISQTFSFWRLIWNSSAHLPKPMQCTGTKNPPLNGAKGIRIPFSKFA